MTSTKPIFIVGMGRSGTTLLTNIVRSHPDVEVLPRDQPWWRFFYGSRRYRGLGQDVRALQQLLEDVFSSHTVYNLRMPIDRAVVESRAMALRTPTFGDVFRIILEENARNHGKPRWGLKTPGNEWAAEFIFQAHPDALMVHMVRDPRDVLASARAKQGGAVNPYGHIVGWKRSVKLGERLKNTFQGQYQILRYEDLVAEPAETIRSVFQFLELEYSQEILEATSFGQNSSFGDVSSNHIDSSPVGRYRQHLSPSELAICRVVAGTAMVQHGYPVDELSGVTLARACVRIAYAWPRLKLGRAVHAASRSLGLSERAAVWIRRAEAQARHARKRKQTSSGPKLPKQSQEAQ